MRTGMHLPQGTLAEVLHGIGFMSTLDEAWPPAQPHLNRFPAMVYCSITFILDGAVALPAEEGGARALSGLLISGPRTRPITSVSLAPVRSLSAILYPDAFHLLTGIAPARLQDRDQPAAGWLDADWEAWPPALRERAGDDAAQAAWIESWLAARWQHKRAEWDRDLGESLRGIAGHEGVAETARVLGVGERQVQRRYREHIGVTPAQARRLQRMNEAVYALRDPAANPDTLAALAAELGYADQAHMARELRELTGLPPSRLEAHIASDRDYWAYRL
jgi:AraC-like DNA-binding protein